MVSKHSPQNRYEQYICKIFQTQAEAARHWTRAALSWTTAVRIGRVRCDKTGSTNVRDHRVACRYALACHMLCPPYPDSARQLYPPNTATFSVHPGHKVLHVFHHIEV